MKSGFVQHRALMAILLGLWIGAGNAAAQDSHYWDNQYGTKAELLGGLVVGAGTDLSATFYNPGWIAMQNEASVLLTTKAAEIYQVKLDNNTGRGDDPASTVVTPSPGYIAGRFSLGEDWGWKWAYTYLQKVQFEFNTSGIRVDDNPAPPADGNLWFSGEAFRDFRVRESWYGVSFSRKLNDNMAVGFSPYVAERSHRSRLQVTAQALDAASNFANAFVVDEFDYWHIRVLLKAGLAVQWDDWSAGIAITTPSLGLFGSGDVYQNVSLSGDYNEDSPGTDPPYLQANHQQDLSPVWKSPLSIAFGGARQFGATKVHVAAEWFNSISRYKILDPESYETQSVPGQMEEYNLEYAAESVFNFGVGVDHAYTETFSLFSSYRADFSMTPKDLDNEISIAVWDLNHLTGGASFQFLSMEFTAGLQFSWGTGDSDRFASFNVEETGDINGTFADREVSYRRLKALLGFNLPFATPGG